MGQSMLVTNNTYIIIPKKSINETRLIVGFVLFLTFFCFCFYFLLFFFGCFSWFLIFFFLFMSHSARTFIIKITDMTQRKNNQGKPIRDKSVALTGFQQIFHHPTYYNISKHLRIKDLTRSKNNLQIFILQSHHPICIMPEIKLFKIFLYFFFRVAYSLMAY